MNVNQFSLRSPSMEPSPSKGLFFRCVQDWLARGYPTPEVTGRESPSPASIEQKISMFDQGVQLQEADDADRSAASCLFAAGTYERESSQPSRGRARSEELETCSVRGKRTAPARAAADASGVSHIERHNSWVSQVYYVSIRPRPSARRISPRFSRDKEAFARTFGGS